MEPEMAVPCGDGRTFGQMRCKTALRIRALQALAMCAVIVCAAIVLAFPALALSPAQTVSDGISGVCRDDFKAHCANLPPGSKEALQCLQQNAPQVSSACREALAKLPTPEQISSIRSACRFDYIAHCSNVAPGGRDALQCLQQHASEASSGCREAMARVN